MNLTTDMVSFSIWPTVARLLFLAALTILIETPVMLLCLKKEAKNDLGIGHLIAYSALINAITNLLLNVTLYVLRWFHGFGVLGNIILVGILEIFVVVEEWLLYKAAFGDSVSKKKRILTVLLANATSLIIGIIISSIRRLL